MTSAFTWKLWAAAGAKVAAEEAHRYQMAQLFPSTTKESRGPVSPIGGVAVEDQERKK
jgi:hypothetical protein